MDRRMFLGTLAGGFLAAPVAAEAQPATTVPRIGVLSFGFPPTPTSPSDPVLGLRSGLRDLGYVEGRNVSIQWRYAETQPDRLVTFAAELVQLKVDVIVVGGPVVLEAARKVTTTIPIVAVSGNNPVREGWAQTVARPGGNIAGLTVTFPEVGPKRLQVLKEAVPSLARVALLFDPTELPDRNAILRAMENGARAIGVALQNVEMEGPNDFETAFRIARKGHADGLLTIDTAKILFQRVRLAQLTMKNRFPAIGEFQPFAEAGFLMTYGANLGELSRRAATYVDKILKGVKPGDLPIEQPTKFELVINLKTAKALGLTIPPSLLQRADQVIE